MSRLHELIEQAKASNPELGNALAEEVQRLEDRPTFGLVFERHAPEATELYGRPITQGDKVHVLNERGSTAKADQTLWRVEEIYEGDAEGPETRLVETLPGNQEWDARAIGRDPQERIALVENLVVVAEHTDTIYPGLVETGRVDNGPEDAPAHTIINAENLHALQALTYTHRHSIDCIYIDPPYNTGAKDWKYNNDYVDGNDDYRHSKWLSFMERRLKLAKELLNPADSVLIVTIDEKEYHRLAMLLEQVFPEANIQMVSSLINRKGVSRGKSFRRVDEYIFFCWLGSAGSSPVNLDELWPEDCECSTKKTKRIGALRKKGPDWTSMMRRGSNSLRSDRKNLFYPIYVDPHKREVVDYGLPIADGHHEAPIRDGLVAVLPLRTNGEEGNWQCEGPEMMKRKGQGRIRVGSPTSYGFVINYLPKGAYESVMSDDYEIEGFASDGSLVAYRVEGSMGQSIAPTQWSAKSHNSSEYGTGLVKQVLGQKRFTYPKSLYAVEDTIRFAVKEKRDATILDFFSGSGTTTHAVMRLNKQDGGRRRSISVTNNEVSAEEQRTLRESGLRPGDSEWEALGIADYVTKPRVTAAITGKTPEGDPIKGDYKFTDEFPMSDGFEANARYFSLEYLNPVMVEYGYAFSRIAPLLWIRAGQVGPVIEELPDRGWEVTDYYAVIENCDDAPTFTEAVKERPGITHVYIITDNVSVYRRVARGFDDSIQAIQLYESYLTNFAINASRVLK